MNKVRVRFGFRASGIFPHRFTVVRHISPEAAEGLEDALDVFKQAVSLFFGADVANRLFIERS